MTSMKLLECVIVVAASPLLLVIAVIQIVMRKAGFL